MSSQTLQGRVEQNAQDGAIVEIDDNSAYYFDIINNHTISLQSQITDNYLENNTAVADHIALSPITVNLSGLSGELVYKVPSEYINNPQQYLLEKSSIWEESNTPIIQKLSEVKELLPEVDNYTKAKQDLEKLITLNTERVVNIFKTLKSEGVRDLDTAAASETETSIREARLEVIYDKLSTLRRNHKPLRVTTPFKILDNMYIQSVTFKQGDSNYIADIELSLKELKFAQTQTTKANKEVMDKYNQIARATMENKGKAQGVKIENKSMLRNLGEFWGYIKES